MPSTYVDAAVCPACDHQGMEYNAEQIDLPYLGESLETMLRCGSCGYRHTDFVLTQIKEPMRHTFTVSEADHMSVRIVRSASGTVRIPELGILIEPGIASEAFISNVEGILNRIERVLDQLHRDAEDGGETQQRIQAMLATFDDLRAGTADPVTVILEDPFGNSAILHDDVVKQALSPEEAATLQTGMFVIDQGSDEPGAGAA